MGDRSRETAVLLQLRKRELLKAIRDAQAGDEAADAPTVPAGELIAIDRMEKTLASRQRVLKARQMTRAFRASAGT